MKVDFEKRVILERIVDTQTYRYAYVEHGTWAEIVRIKLTDLDTTNAIDGWEQVKEYQ